MEITHAKWCAIHENVEIVPEQAKELVPVEKQVFIELFPVGQMYKVTEMFAEIVSICYHSANLYSIFVIPYMII